MEQDAPRSVAARLRVALRQRDEFLGNPLRFFRLVPRRVDPVVGDQRRDEVAEEGLAVRRGAGERAVFHVSACHDEE